jgi:hypothetical protein
MRRFLVGMVVGLATIVSVAAAAPPPDPYETVPATEYPFPLPKDATPQKAAASDKTSKKPSAPSKKTAPPRITVYDVPRGRDAVVAEVRAALKKDGWEITKDEPSPSGNAVRLTVKRSGKLWKASFTGDDQRAVLILTAP